MSTRKFITISIGDVFGRLTVLSEAHRRGYSRYWLCQCSCGSAPKEIYQGNLGMPTKSCGCLVKEINAKKNLARSIHGKSHTPEYGVWLMMRGRCFNPNNSDVYKEYKDRAPPKAWDDFEIFFADMGPRPSPKHSIERVDNNKPYGPENCIWATRKVQNRNSNNNVNVEYQGRTQCIAAWAEEYNMKYSTLYRRLVTKNWPIEKALTKGVQ